MTTLPERLRSLADLIEPDIKWALLDLEQGFLSDRLYKVCLALREAAEALEQSTVQETIRVLNVKLSQVSEERDALRAENARLREALQEASDYVWCEDPHIGPPMSACGQCEECLLRIKLSEALKASDAMGGEGE